MEKLGDSKEDVIATLTRISAQAICEHYHQFAPKNKPTSEIFMCGGGAHNPNITDYIQSQFPDTRLTWLDEVNVPGDAKEAINFAWMGMEAIVGRPMLAPKNVETDEPCVVGKITPGANFRGDDDDGDGVWQGIQGDAAVGEELEGGEGVDWEGGAWFLESFLYLSMNTQANMENCSKTRRIIHGLFYLHLAAVMNSMGGCCPYMSHMEGYLVLASLRRQPYSTYVMPRVPLPSPLHTQWSAACQRCLEPVS